MKEMEFKVGDKVKIIGNEIGHEFNIGDKAVISEICDDGTIALTKGDETWYALPESIKLKKKKNKLTLEKIISKIHIDNLTSIRIFSDYSGAVIKAGTRNERLFSFQGLKDLNKKLDKLIEENLI